MLKRDYFIKAMHAQCYRYKRWVIEAFSLTNANDKTRPYPYALSRREDGRYTFVDPESQQVIVLEDRESDFTPGELVPAFRFTDRMVLFPDEVPNLKEEVNSTYGQLLVNFLCLIYPFGGKIEYMNGPIVVKRMEKIIEKRLVDDPPEGKSRNLTDLYVDEYKRFNEAVGSLVGFTQLCVPSATPKSLMTGPAVLKRRDELLKEHAHELNDPVIQSKIDAELVALDKEWLKDDPAARFLIKDKNYAVARKKMFILQGEEHGFGETQGVIGTSLNEGWDIEKLSAMASSLREGTYSRGASTALGGEATKFNYRIFQNTVIAEEDCGTTLGMHVIIPKAYAANYISSSIIAGNGKVVELTDENIDSYVDRPVVLRSPVYCKTPDQNFCAVCMGKRIAEHPTALSSYAASVGSLFLNLFLKKMHGTVLSTASLDLDQALT